MDSSAFDGHLQFCRRFSWGPVVNVRAPGLRAFDKVHPGVPKPAGGFHVPLYMRDNEDEQQVPDKLVTLQIYRCKRQLSSTSWEETMASQRVSSIRKWVGIMSAGLDSFVLGRQLALDGPHATSLSDCLRHVFSDKATGTLHGRAGPILRYIKWCQHESLKPFPVIEGQIYLFMRSQAQTASPTFLRSFVVALCFCGHVLGLIGACDCMNSRRICGLAKQTFLEKKRSNQKSPLTVRMVSALEYFTAGEENLARDRVAAGCFLLCIYLRARYSDMLALSGIRADEVHMDGIVEGYLEATASRSKSSYTLERKTTLLPMAGPRRGVSRCDWFKHWQVACIQSGVKHGEGLPLLPAPCRGGWARVPLPAHEGAVWLKQILISAGIEETELCNVGTHSLKVTGLSWSARYGLPLEVRRQLGYHVGPNEKMTLLYSRDAAASPLRQFESVLAAIRSDAFRPDLTRSGYFVTANPSDVVEVHDDEVPPGPKQGGSVSHSSTNSSSSSSEDSCDEEDRADDMDKEEEAQECILDPWSEHATNVAAGVSVPDLFRNKQTRYIHVIADESGDRFRCGRTLSEAYTQLGSEPKFCTPQCKQCFKKR